MLKICITFVCSDIIKKVISICRPRSSSPVRTSVFHLENYGLESHMRYDIQKKNKSISF